MHRLLSLKLEWCSSSRYLVDHITCVFVTDNSSVPARQTYNKCGRLEAFTSLLSTNVA
jgi:hypothetical protein